MARFRILLPLVVLFGLVATAGAQVNVALRFKRTQFLAGEPVPVNVTIQNLSGRDLIFTGTSEIPWIDFILTSSRGVPLTPVAKAVFGTVKIPAGQSMTRSVDLNGIFPLRELGNYAVYAVVRLPGQNNDGYHSNRHQFSVSNSKPTWSQTVGVPGSPNKRNDFRLIQFSAGDKNQLYAQIADHATGIPIRTHHLGEMIPFRKPSVTVDSSLNMHVLYLITPAIWGHVRIAPDGRFLGRDFYKSTDLGDPALAKLGDGSVQAVGGIPYDPKKQAEEAAKARKASERPDFIYE